MSPSAPTYAELELHQNTAEREALNTMLVCRIAAGFAQFGILRLRFSNAESI